MTTTAIDDKTSRLEEILSRRIMILDGSMGALLYSHELTEEQFRGERFARHGFDLKNCTEVLVLTQPKLIEDIHRSLPRSRRRHHRDGLVQRHRPVARGVRPARPRFRDEQGRGRAGAAGGRRVHAQDSGKAAIRGGQHRADQETALDGNSCRGPRPPRRDLRPDGRQLQGAGPGLGGRRGRHSAVRNLIRYVGLESLFVRHRLVLRGDRPAAAGDDLRYDLRQSAHPVDAADRGILLLGLSLRRAQRRASTAPSAST